jgi:hypothetical protein
MKKILPVCITILLTIIIGCDSFINITTRKKPYIIQVIFRGSVNCRYSFMDANAEWGHFIDSCGKYNIGDTIK